MEIKVKVYSFCMWWKLVDLKLKIDCCDSKMVSVNNMVITKKNSRCRKE